MQHSRVRGAGWNDRPDVRFWLDDEIYQDWSLNRSRSFDGRADLFVTAHGNSGDAIRFSQLLKVRRADLDLGVVLGVEQILPLADHPQIAVVDDGDIEIEVLLHRSGELVGRHLKTAVADHCPNFEVGASDLGTDSRRQTEAHRAQPS